jgi:hypothetical protein
MVEWARSPARWSCVQLCLSFALLAACGRVGVQPLPVRRGADAGVDSGTPGPVSCPTACENAHGTADCSSGSCVVACANGYQDCDADASNGCEVSVQDATSQCGSCTLACSNEHGLTGCEQGLCTPSCAAGFADCDGLAANGCETELNSAQNCGACGKACENSHGSASCASGTCTISCDSAHDDCDGNAANGCETSIASDPTHCGSCSGVCQAGSQICSAGSCIASNCPAGAGECDGDLASNCETDLTSSPTNCGFCGNSCSAANGSAQCSSSACSVASCDSGYADCDGMPGNGCESTLASGLTNCGGCGNACSNAHGSTSCLAGACTPICSSGFGDCDGDPRNGCEVALDSVSNCGMCGKVCAANGGTPDCAAGVCTTSCSLSGRYALKLSIPASWPATSVLDSGSGTFVYWGELQLIEGANDFAGTLWLCGASVPDFASTPLIHETYGLTFPNALFGGPLPSTASSGTLGSRAPGASFMLAPSALLAGASLTDPVNDAWPKAGSITSIDSDGDGKPGLTVLYKSGGSYSLPPTNDFGTTRAMRGYIATRIVFSLSGTLTSCTQSSGALSAQDIDSHTLGCRVSGDSRDCSSSDWNHLDSNTPGYSTSPGTYSLVKLSDAASCSDVRSTLP